MKYVIESAQYEIAEVTDEQALTWYETYETFQEAKEALLEFIDFEIAFLKEKSRIVEVATTAEETLI